MAWSSITIPSGELNALTDNQPILYGVNALRDFASNKWGQGLANPSPNEEAALFPADRAADDYADIITKIDTAQTTAGTTAVYLHFDGNINPQIFDSVFIFNHNFNTLANSLGGNIEVDIFIADDADFTVRLQNVTGTITFTAGVTNPRYSQLVLQDTLTPTTNPRFSGVEHVVVRITATASNFDTLVPAIGEVFLGRRRQLARKSIRPFDEEMFKSNFADVKSKSGSTTRHVFSSGQRVVKPNFSVGGANKYSIDDVNQLRQWYKECTFGTRPSVYLEDGNTAKPLLVTPMDLEEFELPQIDVFEREISLEFEEQPPFVSDED